MLGSMFKNKFKTGDYVEWRRICRNENYEEIVKTYQGIIVSIFPVDVGSRNVYYAKVIKNGGNEEIVLLSKIRKIETN
tara:strand:+ start:7921 stop:8154 length:234 start_codon:yes stop_codon:yes gene_type:complete